MNNAELYIGVACLVTLIATVEASDVFTKVMLGISAVICIGGAFDNDKVDRRALKNDTERISGQLDRIELKLKEMNDVPKEPRSKSNVR